MEHEHYMALALELAEQAASEGEVPVGCVIVQGEEIVGRGRNTRETENSALGHAEINAIADACRSLNSWRLDSCRLYVTLEPCLMCAGAIYNARIPAVFYGARDSAAGACGGVLNVFAEGYTPSPALVGGVRERECAEILGKFFEEIRKKSFI